VDRSYLHKIMNSHKMEYRYYKRPAYEKTLAIGQAVNDVRGAMVAADRLREYEERMGLSAPTPPQPNAERVLDVIKNLLSGLDDPLARIGQDVDIRQFGNLPLSTSPASAGESLLTDNTTESEQFSEILHGDVRTIRVEGDCMEPFYRHADILFVQRAASAETGNTVIALLDGESVACKVFRQDEGSEYLEANNGAYPRITGDFRIVGIVKGSYRP